MSRSAMASKSARSCSLSRPQKDVVDDTTLSVTVHIEMRPWWRTISASRAESPVSGPRRPAAGPGQGHKRAAHHRGRGRVRCAPEPRGQPMGETHWATTNHTLLSNHCNELESVAFGWRAPGACRRIRWGTVGKGKGGVPGTGKSNGTGREQRHGGTGKSNGTGTGKGNGTGKSAAILVGVLIAGAGGCGGSPGGGWPIAIPAKGAQRDPARTAERRQDHRVCGRCCRGSGACRNGTERPAETCRIRPAVRHLRRERCPAQGPGRRLYLTWHREPPAWRDRPVHRNRRAERSKHGHPVRCVLRGAVVERPRPSATASSPATTSSAANPVPVLPAPPGPGTAGARAPSASSAAELQR